MQLTYGNIVSYKKIPSLYEFLTITYHSLVSIYEMHHGEESFSVSEPVEFRLDEDYHLITSIFVI